MQTGRSAFTPESRHADRSAGLLCANSDIENHIGSVIRGTVGGLSRGARRQRSNVDLLLPAQVAKNSCFVPT
jgi:hypothetical protein